MPEPCITEIRGQVFPSQAAAAKHFNVNPVTIHHAIERGTVDDVGLGRNYRRKMPVWRDEVRYESQAALARDIGVDHMVVQGFIRRAKRYGRTEARTKWGVLTW